MAGDEVAQAQLYALGRAAGRVDAQALGVRPEDLDPVSLLARARGDDPTWSGARVEVSSLGDTVELLVDLPSTPESERAHGGPSGEPRCGMTAGYLSGWCEGIVGRPLETQELTCRVEGHARCRFLISEAVMSEATREALASRDAELHELRARLEHERAAREDAERRLGQAHKLEALGHMSGGIAHDFNNLMTVVLARGTLLEKRLGGDPAAHDHLREMVRATERAAGLTRQLLAFSRVRPADHEPIDVGDALGRVGRMLESLVGDEIELEFGLPPEPLPALIDRGELEQVVMNLVVNARDALDGAGRLWVSASARNVRAHRQLTSGALSPGRYAVLAVRDTGVGISPEVLERIFDPFFTTKSEGQGTGLGLATVNALVMKNGGAIEVATTPGGGSCFEVFLPLVSAEQADAPREAAPKGKLGRGETIVVVDDRPEIRVIVCDLLSADGYRPLSFDGGEAALAWARGDERAQLLLTDVKMPHMDGPVLAEGFKALQPGVPVLYMSGFSEYAVHPLLPKPFSASELLSAVRAALEEGRRGLPTRPFVELR